MDGNGWKWINLDENRWNWIKIDKLCFHAIQSIFWTTLCVKVLGQILLQILLPSFLSVAHFAPISRFQCEQHLWNIKQSSNLLQYHPAVPWHGRNYRCCLVASNSLHFHFLCQNTNQQVVSSSCFFPFLPFPFQHLCIIQMLWPYMTETAFRYAAPSLET